MRTIDFLFGLPQPARRRLRAAAFLALLAVAAFARFDGLGEPSLWLDEILHVEQARSAAAAMDGEPWTRWPSALTLDKENGPLYYAGQVVSLSLFADEGEGSGPIEGRVEAAARLMPALAGVAAVAALFFVVLRATGSGALALVAMALLAVAPLHVDYSREGRPYAAVMLAAMLMVLLGFAPRRRWVVPAVYLLAAATAGLGAVAAPVLASFIAVGALSRWLRKRSLYRKWHWQRDLHLAVACGLGLLLMTQLFPTVPGLSEMSGTVTEAPDHGEDLSFASPISVRSFDRLLTSLTTSGLDSSSASWLSFVVLAFGLWGAARWTLHDSTSALWLVGLCVLPIAGWFVLLQHFDHWYNVRYTSAALPAFLALVAYGLVDAADALSLWTGRFFWKLHMAALPAAFLGGVLLTILAPNWAASRTEPWQKPDWRGAAELIALLSEPDEPDPVIARDDWAGTCLRFYLQPHDVPVVPVNYDLDAARALSRQHPSAWVAAAGYREGPWFEPLLRGLDPVLRAGRANFRLFRFPGFGSIPWRAIRPDDGERLAVCWRASVSWTRTPRPAGVRARRGAARRRLVGTGDRPGGHDVSLGGVAAGGAGARSAGRVGGGSSPAPALHALSRPDRPPQTISARVNGQALPPCRWSRAGPSSTLPPIARRVPVDVVVFDFGWTQSPRELDPASGDGRSWRWPSTGSRWYRVRAWSASDPAATKASRTEQPGRVTSRLAAGDTLDFSWTDDQTRAAPRRRRVRLPSASWTAWSSATARRLLPRAVGRLRRVRAAGPPGAGAWDGGGQDLLSAVAVSRAIGYGARDNGLVFSVAAHAASCEGPLAAFGSDAQKASGCRGWPTAARSAPPASPSPTRARTRWPWRRPRSRTATSWVLDGSKTFVTNAPVADLFVVYARTGGSGFAGLTCFLVPRTPTG